MAPLCLPLTLALLLAVLLLGTQVDAQAGCACQATLDQQARAINEIAAKLQDVKDRQDRAASDVSFHVRMQDDPFGVTRNKSVKFDVVATNNGRGYDPHTGVFTAPLTGTYHMSVSCMAKHTSTDRRLGLAIMVDGQKAGSCWSMAGGNHDGFLSEQGAATVTQWLNKGSQVYTVPLMNTTARGGYETTWGGFLVRPTL